MTDGETVVDATWFQYKISSAWGKKILVLLFFNLRDKGFFLCVFFFIILSFHLGGSYHCWIPVVPISWFLESNSKGKSQCYCLQERSFVIKDNSVINYDKDLLSLVLCAGVFNKASHNPFRKKYFLLLKIVLAKYKSSDPCHCCWFFEGHFPTFIV